MDRIARFLKPAVTSLTLLCAAPLAAQDNAPLPEPQVETLAELYDRLADPAAEDWEAIERRIVDRWSRTGSVAMDLLLSRGRDAIDAEDWAAAVDHLTALTDHAPDVAEGWHLRATAFFQQGRYGEALEDLGRTLALDPRHYNAMAGLAVILGEMGDRDGALAVWRMVKVANPHRPDLDAAITDLERETQGSDI
ncbi:MAG: tetratricopeptide repeat protein [Rhodobacteraceae bacterium]|nr:tetratricopeptide repeat protein [Paracoccaceae bacterium]